MSSSSSTSPFSYTDVVGQITNDYYSIYMEGSYTTETEYYESENYGSFGYTLTFQPNISIPLNFTSPNGISFTQTSNEPNVTYYPSYYCADQFANAITFNTEVDPTTGNYLTVQSLSGTMLIAGNINSFNNIGLCTISFDLNYTDISIPYDSTSYYFESNVPLMLTITSVSNNNLSNYTFTYSGNTVTATGSSTSYPTFTITINSVSLLFCSNSELETPEEWINTLLNMTLTNYDTDGTTINYTTTFTVTSPIYSSTTGLTTYGS
jgi:hypothetical protein